MGGVFYFIFLYAFYCREAGSAFSFQIFFSEKKKRVENKKVKREKNKWKEYSSSKVVSCLETPPECQSGFWGEPPSPGSVPVVSLQSGPAAPLGGPSIRRGRRQSSGTSQQVSTVSDIYMVPERLVLSTVYNSQEIERKFKIYIYIYQNSPKN